MANTAEPTRIIRFDVYELREWKDDPQRRFRLFRDNQEVFVPTEKTGKFRPLSEGRLKLLAYFATESYRNGGRPIGEEAILDANWGKHTKVFSNVVEKAVGKLYLAFKDATGPIIEPVYGIGYRFVPTIRIDPPPDAKPIGNVTLSEPVTAHYFKNDELGAAHLVNQYRSPRLQRVFNTYVRLEQHRAEYRKETVIQLALSLKAFVDRSANENGRPCLFEVLGGYPEIGYLQTLVDIATSDERREQKIAFHWLSNSTPMMNFIILEFEDDPNGHESSSEVLFGWGGHSASSPEAVFRSDHPELVKEFRELYSLLLRPDISCRKTALEIGRELDKLRRLAST
jgi:DNA-binding winged helix-turn-helix (wHTH) protein